VYAREGESLALLSDQDPAEAAGLAAWAASRRPWPDILGDETSEPYFRDLLQFVDMERTRYEVYPKSADVFAAFHLTPYDNVKVVILGQDPYPQPGEANGLSFSVPRDGSPPKSLRNIFAAMRHDQIAAPEHGDLTAWAQQGVLLLNTALTVRRADPGSHAKEWRAFTDAVIPLLSAREDPLVFVLWGRAAQRKKRLIDTDRHGVIEAPHPAARGVAQVRFREARTFSAVDRTLRAFGRAPVNWTIK
jgi:uracil-DNA glycosylase